MDLGSLCLAIFCQHSDLGHVALAERGWRCGFVRQPCGPSAGVIADRDWIVCAWLASGTDQENSRAQQVGSYIFYLHGEIRCERK